MNGIYGLIGRKLGHSYSPQIHSYLGDYEYNIYEMEEDAVGSFLKNREFDAINVTIPYKKTVMPFLDRIDASALKIGSVNTIVKEADGTLTGYNTDYYGFSYMLKKGNIDVCDKKVMILGDGGASATVQCVVKDMNAAEIIVVSRHTDTNYDNIHLHYDSDIIINTTPVGMYPKNLEVLVDLDKFSNLSGVADLIYNPERTQLILDAGKKGINCISGLYMLSAQAKKAAEYFFRKDYDEGIIDFIVEKLSFELTNIVLVGMPGCGKTTIGTVLAEHYGRKLVDMDALIVEKAGMTIPEIFALQGETGFRKIEAEVAKEVGKEKELVISTGGGVIVTPGNHDALRQNATVVFINRDISVLPTDGRPLSQKNSLQEMYNKRLPLYRSICHHEVDGNGTVEEVAERIEALFR
ncbi:MAG: shikimate kinase [Clostridia bacterium]|nr:shikimate kinase [Clostridia bacterium]